MISENMFDKIQIGSFILTAAGVAYGAYATGMPVYEQTNSFWQALTVARTGASIYGIGAAAVSLGIAGGMVLGSNYLDFVKEKRVENIAKEFMKKNPSLKYDVSLEHLVHLHKNLKEKYPEKEGLKTVLKALDNKEFQGKLYSDISEFSEKVLGSKDMKMVAAAENEKIGNAWKEREELTAKLLAAEEKRKRNENLYKNDIMDDMTTVSYSRINRISKEVKKEKVDIANLSPEEQMREEMKQIMVNR